MTPFFKKLHKWLGLLIGLQFTLWMLSGLAMNLFDHDRVQGKPHRAAAPQTPPPLPSGLLDPARLLADIAAAQPVAATEDLHDAHGAPVLETAWLLDLPVYRFSQQGRVRLYDARNGSLVAVTPETARVIASADYHGSGVAAAAQAVVAPTLETRRHTGAVWRIDFDDADATTLYVSAADGRILERRNRSWRWFDLFWMLHIMDYTGRENFNNPLLVIVAFCGLWLALSGFWLLCTSLRLREFVPPALRTAVPPLNIHAEDGSLLGHAAARRGDTVFASLGRAGLQLPSSCGGGQSCGLCEVRVRGTAPPPPTAGDRALISAAKLRQGYRLACNLSAADASDIEVAASDALWKPVEAVVIDSRAVTPWMREISFRPADGSVVDFTAGSYIQLHVPAYSLRTADLRATADPAWSELLLPEQIQCKTPVRRAYSLSSPPADDGLMSLLVRFSPGRPNKSKLPAGKGSSYLHALKPGDSFVFSGPFGDFRARPGERDLVMLGGGAGMAPLRAMLLDQLQRQRSTRRIHFWYGARSLRDLPYADDMHALAVAHPNFRWQLVLSESEEGGDDTLHGLVHEVFETRWLMQQSDPASTDYLVCGPPPMLAACRKLLQRHGVPENAVAYDDFRI